VTVEAHKVVSLLDSFPPMEAHDWISIADSF